METKKTLYRSSTNKVLAGVIGGLGEYFDTDPTILRLVYVVIAILTGFVPAIIGYIIAVLIIPQKPSSQTVDYTEVKKESEVK